MRRGLKQKRTLRRYLTALRLTGFKPIPDEEGTETKNSGEYHGAVAARLKPIPDEEGTETIAAIDAWSWSHAVLQTDPR